MTMGAGIDIWRIAPASGGLAALRAILSPEEAARADAFRFAPDRARYVSFRGALRQVLGRYLGWPPGGIAIETCAYGKPHLPGGRLDFNLAHSGDAALLAVSGCGPVGIDFEGADRTPDHDRLAARVLSAHERAVFDALPADQRRAAFLRVWTRKEAYLKATGEGLSFALDKISVTLAPGDPPRIVAVQGRPDAPARWRLHDLAPGGDAVGALASLQPDAAPRWFDHAALDG
jgi:4'-phosphopantetheinyl transferase